MLWRSALRADFTAMLGLGSSRQTRCVRFAHCAQTVATSMLTKRAARADPRPALLVAPEIAPAAHRPPRSSSAACDERSARTPTVSVTHRASLIARTGSPIAPNLLDAHHRRICKGVCGPATARLSSAEKRRACAQREARPQTDSPPMSERRERSEQSEFGGGPQDRASQGSRRAATTAASKRCGRPACAFAAPPIACIPLLLCRQLPHMEPRIHPGLPRADPLLIPPDALAPNPEIRRTTALNCVASESNGSRQGTTANAPQCRAP